MTKTFAERCHIAQQFLPDAQYKAMLTALHTEMLAALAEQPAPLQEPVAWMSDRAVGFKKSEFGATPTVPLYTTIQAQPAREPLTAKEIAEFVGTHEYGPEQLKWFRLGEAAHNIKEQE